MSGRGIPEDGTTTITARTTPTVAIVTTAIGPGGIATTDSTTTTSSRFHSLARPVTLRDGANKIVVELRGVPRTSLTVEIVGAGPQPPDDVPPVITTNVDPLPNGNGWNRTNVTVTFSCSDSGSGIETCPAPVTVSTEGANQIVSGTAVDKAGNAATASAR